MLFGLRRGLTHCVASTMDAFKYNPLLCLCIYSPCTDFFKVKHTVSFQFNLFFKKIARELILGALKTLTICSHSISAGSTGLVPSLG